MISGFVGGCEEVVRGKVWCSLSTNDIRRNCCDEVNFTFLHEMRNFGRYLMSNENL